MASQWALIIGINQYKALQPLMYAQEDAISLRNLFVDQLGVSIHNCTLLTDIAAGIEPHAYAPIKQEIEQQLQTLCRENVQPDDLLWVFFSGCGLTDGGKDYWMTLDSDPTNLPGTAIALTTVFEILSQARTDQIVLAMDMNRSKGAIGNRHIGAQTLDLANHYSIPTFLSCRPEEYAHETMYVRQGLFTKGLLEGLYYHGCITATQLENYLSSRVPELCSHYSRPPQNPIAAIPAAKKFMMVLPRVGVNSLSLTEGAAENLAVTAPSSLPTPSVPSDFPVYEEGMTNPVLTERPAPPLEPRPTVNGTANPPSPAETIASIPAPLPTPISGGAIVSKPDDSPEDASPAIGTIWKWGAALAALAFLAGVLLQYRNVLFGGAANQAVGNNSARVATGTSPGNQPDVQGQNSQPPTAATANSQPPAEMAESGQNQTGEALFPPGVEALQTGETALQRAEAAIAAGRYGEARAWLSQVPPELQNEQYQALQQQANSEVANAAARNQGILNEARKIIQPTSASAFNNAIEQARQVPPADPYYEQAQADIARWSQVILDLAEGRAATGDINGAIAAARLVPEDQPAVFALAQQRITIWEQQIANQNLIQQVQNSLQPGQASSFNDAIRALEQITPDQPAYNTAREKVNQWSGDILAIARARAAQNDIAGAIAAAQLVPPNSDAYAQAQQELQRWQEQQ